MTSKETQLSDITERFALESIDHHELLVLLGIRYPSAWRLSDDEIAFPATEKHDLKLEIRHGVIGRIERGEGLSDETLEQILAASPGEPGFQPEEGGGFRRPGDGRGCTGLRDQPRRPACATSPRRRPHAGRVHGPLIS
jgi:hypothetical protein